MFGPRAQEEATMDAVGQQIQGSEGRLQAFVQGELDRTRDFKRAVVVRFPLDLVCEWSVGAP